MGMDLLVKDEMRSIEHHNYMMRMMEEEKRRTETGYQIANAEDRAHKDSEKAKAMASSVGFYKTLLSRPMAEIAELNADFAETYYVQNQHMSDWMLSQKAFKELALDFGSTLGLSEEQVDDEYLLRVSEVAAGEREEKIEPGFERHKDFSVQRLNAVIDKKRGVTR